MFSVAPTLGKSKSILAPIILSHLHTINPAFSVIFTPNFSKLFKWRSIGLAPMSHPPGYENLTSLNLPKIAPAKITVERIWCIKCSGISFLVIFFELTSTFPLFFFTLHPKNFKISCVILVSLISGTLYNFVVPEFSMLDANIGSDAFFEPDTSTSPSSLLPPSIM